MKNGKNSDDLHVLIFFYVRRIIKYWLLDSLSRKMETKVMIADLYSSKGSRYKTHKNEGNEDRVFDLIKITRNRYWKLNRSHTNQYYIIF